MSLKNEEKNKAEKQTKIADIEEEYDEDLEELSIEEIIDYNTNEDEDDYLEKNADNAIKKNISSCLLCSEIVKWFMFIMAFIYLLIGISTGDTIWVWLIVSVTFILSGIISSMMLKWFGYVLKCLYDIKMK